MPEYPTTKFDRAIDRTIAAENARILATFCKPCAGTGRYYLPPTDGTSHWTRHTCPTCGGSGDA